MTEIPQEIADMVAALDQEFATIEDSNNADKAKIVECEHRISEHEKAITERDRRQDEILAEKKTIKDLNRIWLAFQDAKTLDTAHQEFLKIDNLPLPQTTEDHRTFAPTNTERVLKLFQETARPMSSNEVHAAIGDGRTLNTIQVVLAGMKKSGTLLHDGIVHVFWPSAWGRWRVPSDQMAANLSALEEAS